MNDLWAALCLVLVLEGLLPFVSPRAWKSAVAEALKLDDRSLRLIGAGAILIGLLFLQLLR